MHNQVKFLPLFHKFVLNYVSSFNQLLARYNTERFCNNLERIKPLDNLRERVPEGYYSKMVRSLSNRAYPGKDNLQFYAEFELRKSFFSSSGWCHFKRHQS